MTTAQDAECRFFSALTSADISALNELLSEDFILVDVMAGSVITKGPFVGAIESGQVHFTEIQPLEADVRTYGNVAVIVGRTAMSGEFGGKPFSASSRYTHVFARLDGKWRLVSAQGTQIKDQG